MLLTFLTSALGPDRDSGQLLSHAVLFQEKGAPLARTGLDAVVKREVPDSAGN